MKHLLKLLLATIVAFTPFITLEAQGTIQEFNTSNSNLVNNNIKAIDYDSQGNVWIGTSNGISVYNNGNWTTYTTSNSNLISNSIAVLFVDSQDNVWIGTTSGVGKFNGSTWSSLTTSNSGLSNNSVRSLAEDNQGNIWFGTSGNGADKYDGSNFTNYNTSDGLAHNFVQGISQDNNGSMWFGTSLGVSKMTSGGSWTTYDDNNSNITSDALNINDLTVDSTGLIWGGSSKGLSSTGGGIPHYDQSSWAVLNSQNSGLVYNDVFDVAVDGTNAIWFATDGGGVSYYDYIDSIWVAFKSYHGLPNNNCQAIGFDTQGNTWVGTDNGLARITPIKVKNYTISNVTCDTVAGSIDINYNAVRNQVYFSIDSGLTFQSSATFNNLMPGDYPVMITDSFAFVYDGKVKIEAIPIEQVDLGADTSICQDESIVLDAGNQFLTYFWNNGLTQQTITVDAATIGLGAHTYSIVTRDSNLCESKDTIVVTVQNCNFIEENNMQFDIRPNPVNSFIDIKTQEKIKQISVYSINGQLLMNFTEVNSRNKKVDVSRLDQGSYIIYLQPYKGKPGRYKFIKQ